MSELALRHSDVPASLPDQMELAKALSTSGLLPDHLRNRPENILALFYAAQSVNIPIWQAFQSMQVISGKVGMSADLHRALILRAGHTFRVVESTDQKATVVGVRRDDPDRYEHKATFTLADAVTAGIANGTSWKKYPKAMLIARATTLLARNAFSDVIAGMAYTPEELGATVDEDGRIVEAAVEAEPRHEEGPLSAIPADDPVLEAKRQIVALGDSLGKDLAALKAMYAERTEGGDLSKADLADLNVFIGLLQVEVEKAAA